MINTVGIQIPDVSGIGMVGMCLVMEWSSFQMAFKNRTFYPVFEWANQTSKRLVFECPVLGSPLYFSHDVISSQ